MITIGFPSGLQQAITAFSNIFVNSYINIFGSAAMAGYRFTHAEIDTFVVLPLQSIALASTTFVGQNLGAKKVERAKEGTRISLIISLISTVTLSGLLYLFGMNLLKVFSQDPEVLHYGNLFLKIFSPFYFAICFNQIYAGALRGAGVANPPMVIMIGCFVVFRQIFLFFGTKIFNTLEFVAVSYPVAWVLCAILMFAYYKLGNWENAKKVVD